MIDGDTATVFFSVSNAGGDDTLTDAESEVLKMRNSSVGLSVITTPGPLSAVTRLTWPRLTGRFSNRAAAGWN